MAKDKQARDARVEYRRWQDEQTVRKLVRGNERDRSRWGGFLPTAEGEPELLEVRLRPSYAVPELGGASPVLWLVYVAGADVMNRTLRRVFKTRELAQAAFDRARDGTCFKTYLNRGFQLL